MNTAAGLALPFYGPRDTARVTRDRIETLSQEVASGRSSDPGRALFSDFSGLSRLSHQMLDLQAVRDSLGQAQTWGATLQISLSQISEAGGRIAAALPASFAAAGEDGFLQAAATARGAAEDIGSALQRSVGGRAVFANGAQTGPLASVQAMLADVDALAAAAVDFDSYLQSVDDYFSAGGSFEVTGLTGYPGDAIRFPSGDGEAISFAVEAGTDEVRNAFKQAALVAGLSEAGFQLGFGDRSAITIELQKRSAGVAADLPNLQGRIGGIEERIAIRLDATVVALQDTELAVSNALGVDPFDAVTRLQNEMTRLESLYAITARRAQLRLTDYL